MWKGRVTGQLGGLLLDGVDREDLSEEPNSRRHRAMPVMQKCPWQEEPGSAPEKKGAQIQHKATGGQLQGYGS